MFKESIPPTVVERRKIVGISAILLPFTEDGSVDWKGFSAHVERTVQAGLAPAVNMDTGYVNLLDDGVRKEVLRRTQAIVGNGSFVAGAFIGDQAGDKWNADAYDRRIDEVQSHNATPVIFQSYGLTNQANDQIVASYEALAGFTDQYIAFELGTMFAPFGKIYDLDTYAGIMAIPQCIGAKHSSLERQPEWDRLEIRNAQRPDFKVFTGNDLGIDMVVYGSDYLLGLSSFAPDLFAMRDKMWEEGNEEFIPLNDLLQELGDFAFRSPTPAYKHSAAQFLKLQNWIGCDATHPNSPTRPDSDVDTLRGIAQRCADWRERA